jgi:hypothetical protein
MKLNQFLKDPRAPKKSTNRTHTLPATQLPRATVGPWPEPRATHARVLIFPFLGSLRGRKRDVLARQSRVHHRPCPLATRRKEKRGRPSVGGIWQLLFYECIFL